MIRKPIAARRYKPARIWRSRLYIIEHREARHMTAAALAKAIGKSAGLVSQIESGRCGASPETLEDIAQLFGLDHVGMLFEPPAPPGYRRQVHFILNDNQR
jgi:transcriptional regulator with XRE-family HTH domain